MSAGRNEHDEELSSTLSTLRQRKSDLEGKCHEHTRYLNEVAAYFSSGEEQQRIVADIRDLRQELAGVDEAIARLTRTESSD